MQSREDEINQFLKPEETVETNFCLVISLTTESSGPLTLYFDTLVLACNTKSIVISAT